MKRIANTILSFILIISVLFALPVTGFAAQTKEKKSGDFKYTVNSNNEVKIVRCINYDKKKIVVPAKIDGKKVTEIGHSAFICNYDVEEIYIKNGLKKIGTDAFKECYHLKYIYIPDSVTYLGSTPFYDCVRLTDLRLSKNLKYMGGSVFNPGYGVKIETYSDGKGGTYYDKYLVALSKDVTEYEVLEGTTLIAKIGSPLDSHLKKISFPKTLKYISDEAFQYRDQLETVVFKEGLKEIGENAFDECPRLKNLTIPKSVKKIGKYAFGHYLSSYVDKNNKQVHVKVKNFVIKGYTNSEAQRFAKSHKLKFSTNALKVPTAEVSAGKKQIKVKYTKSGSATGFEVKYTKGKKSLTKTFKTDKSATKTIKNLSKGKYKVRVRTYHISGNKKAYSSWTAVESINVK